jgi:hypothetical protein
MRFLGSGALTGGFDCPLESGNEGGFVLQAARAFDHHAGGAGGQFEGQRLIRWDFNGAYLSRN